MHIQRCNDRIEHNKVMLISIKKDLYWCLQIEILINLIYLCVSLYGLSSERNELRMDFGIAYDSGFSGCCGA